MRIFYLLTFVAFSSSAFAAPKKSVECNDPLGEDKKKVSVARVKRKLSAVRNTMTKHGVHVLDLSKEVQATHPHLARFLLERNWCAVHEHVIAIEDGLGMMQIDQTFIADKFTRVERWTRAALSDSSQRVKAEKWLAGAAADMADRRFDKSNTRLNRVIKLLFGSDDVWKMPATLPKVQSEKNTTQVATVDRYDVKKGCPTLFSKGQARKEDLTLKLRGLGKLMDKRHLRVQDLKGGPSLLQDLHNYVKLEAHWPAARIACAMFFQFQEQEIDLGLVSKRFQLVKNLHENVEFAADKESKFREMIREASQHIIEQKFGNAQKTFEQLFVLLGEPATPSATLP